MNSEVINAELLDANECFGCGLENKAGLQIELFRDKVTPGQIVGTFRPTEDMVGFPGVVHGGAIYTALDCLATWVAMVNGDHPEGLWLLKKAEMEYHTPADPSEELELRGSIRELSESGTSMTVVAHASNPTGEVVASGIFRDVAVSTDKFLQITGRQQLPENWKSFLAKADELDQLT